MNILNRWDTPQRIDASELIDDPSQPYADLRASMIDVQRANTFLGGTAVVTRQVTLWLDAARASDRGVGSAPLTFLDVATGSADLPLAIVKLAKRTNDEVQVCGLDFSEPILRVAREETSTYPQIRLMRGDAFHLPFADDSFDFVTCSLAFHHFGFEGSVFALKEMERVARRGWLVNDLRRAWSAHYLFRAVSAIAGMNRLTRHDGPASVLRAYSLDEYEAMPYSIGLQLGVDYRINTSLFYRVAIVRDKA